MGVEAAVAIAALNVGAGIFSASSSLSQGKKQSQALIEQGNLQAQQKAIQTKRAAATQKVSFLNSGLLLEGTPINVIESTLSTGIEDINQINRNATSAAKNAVGGARNQAIASIASGLGSAAISGAGAMNFGGGASMFSSGAPVSAVSTAQELQMGQTLPWTQNIGQTLPWRGI
jgi:hypothetical protein